MRTVSEELYYNHASLQHNISDHEDFRPRTIQQREVVNTLKGRPSGFLGFESASRAQTGKGEGYFNLVAPKKAARKAMKAKVHDIIARGGATPRRRQ
jgi:hypothetical protein